MRKNAITGILAASFFLAPFSGQAEVYREDKDAAHIKSASMRGVFFNPVINDSTNFPWLLYYSTYRSEIKMALQEMATEANLNFAAIFLLIPNSLATPKQAPTPGQPLEEWANMAYLDNVAMFIDDCHEAGVSVALDMANNMWVPYSVDTANHLVGVPDDPAGTDPWWPIADDTPWDESVTWYTEIIEYVEGKASHPESIAWWCMGGNYTFGGAETGLWDNDYIPEIKTYNELFVKNVWPAFKAAGQRPKAAPYLMPILSNNTYWMARDDARLSGFTNLKKWLVDDLGMPPDYWPMTFYPLCDPAPNGHYYYKEILDILGWENASRIIPTDLGVLADYSSTILSTEGYTDTELFQWHFDKCAEYGFPGWWIWCYQDGPGETRGIREQDGQWKTDLVQVIAAQMPVIGEDAPVAGLLSLGSLAFAGIMGGILYIRKK